MAELAYRQAYIMNSVEARKRLITTYQETKSIRKRAKMWGTSRQVVRKWVGRFEAEEGLEDRSRRPHHSPRQTPAEIEQRVRGPGRLLITAGRGWPFISKGGVEKDVLDKQALGPTLRDHLPRYQWTACDGRTRLRFLAYSHNLNRTNGLAFLILILLWLRAHGVSSPVTFQTDWGQEFGGDNPDQIAALERRFLQPCNEVVSPGRKNYNGRVERSHRADGFAPFRV